LSETLSTGKGRGNQVYAPPPRIREKSILKKEGNKPKRLQLFKKNVSLVLNTEAFNNFPTLSMKKC
jgi:hypothetical protein